MLLLITRKRQRKESNGSTLPELEERLASDGRFAAAAAFRLGGLSAAALDDPLGLFSERPLAVLLRSWRRDDASTQLSRPKSDS